MGYYLGCFGFPILVGVGWLCSRLSPELSRVLALSLAVFGAAALAILLISGVSQTSGADRNLIGEIHRWTGHGLVILVWQGVPFSTGVLLQRKLRRQSVSAVMQILGLLVLFAAVFLESVLGYSNVVPDSPFNEETHNRFVVLHLYTFPALIAGLLLSWYWALRPEPQPRQIPQSSGVTGESSSNGN